MIAVINEIERRAYRAGDTQTLALLDLMEQTAEECEEATAEALADLERARSEALQRIEGLAIALRAARPLKKAQMLALADVLDSLATDPPEGERAGMEFDAQVRRACGLGGVQ